MFSEAEIVASPANALPLLLVAAHAPGVKTLKDAWRLKVPALSSPEAWEAYCSNFLKPALACVPGMTQDCVQFFAAKWMREKRLLGEIEDRVNNETFFIHPQLRDPTEELLLGMLSVSSHDHSAHCVVCDAVMLDAVEVAGLCNLGSEGDKFRYLRVSRSDILDHLFEHLRWASILPGSCPHARTFHVSLTEPFSSSC